MTIVEINQKLKEFARHPIYDKPIFRIVWSDDQLDYRKGFHGMEGVESVKLVKKYNYIPERFVLEKYVFVGQQRELVNVNGYSYEPVYIFQDKHYNPLPVEWWAVEYAVKFLSGHFAREHRTEKQDQSEYDAKKVQEEAEIYDRLTQEGQAASFASGSAVFLDARKRAYFEE